jgi:hypothetical protein
MQISSISVIKTIERKAAMWLVNFEVFVVKYLDGVIGYLLNQNIKLLGCLKVVPYTSGKI